MRRFDELSGHPIDLTDPAFDDALFWHPVEEVISRGQGLSCRNNEKNVQAVTFMTPGIDWIKFGGGPQTQPSNRAVIYVRIEVCFMALQMTTDIFTTSAVRCSDSEGRQDRSASYS
jgi:hypothetical protein